MKFIETSAQIEEIINKENKSANRFNPSSISLDDKGRLSNPVFKAFGYPSKIYYPSIQEYIRAYTKPGAVVLDSFCGSGTTGIAALLEGRKAILYDSSPQAINLTTNTLLNINLKQVDAVYKELKNQLEPLFKKIYFTSATDGSEGYSEVIISSNIYSCPKCNKEIVLYGNETGERSEYKCNNCGQIINISKQDIKDKLVARRKPVEVTIKLTNKIEGKSSQKRAITEEDLIIWEENYKIYNEKYGHLWSPSEKIVYNRCYPRVGGWPGFPIHSSVSDLFSKTNLLALKILYNYIDNEIKDDAMRRFFLFIFTEILFRTSKRLFTTSGIKNVYHIPPLGKEQNVFSVFERKYKTIVKAKIFLQDQLPKDADKKVVITKGSSKTLSLKDNTLDYAFIDPPYGGVVPYAELNLFYSAWLKEKEDLEDEVIIPMDYEKKQEFVHVWGRQLEEAFSEVYRVLKPGAYFTIVFQSKFNEIWNELRRLMERIGFQFDNIVENKRSTTFHTNSLNDTNPQSAFITYKKPVKAHDLQQQTFDFLEEDVFNHYPLEHLREPRTFREVQSKIIYYVHKLGLKEIPSDSHIENWLLSVSTKEQGKYILK